MLKVYVAAWDAKGKLEASLSDDSAPDFSGYIESTSGVKCRVFVISFKAAYEGQTLTVKYTLDKVYGENFRNISL